MKQRAAHRRTLQSQVQTMQPTSNFPSFDVTPSHAHLSLAQNFLLKQYNFWKEWREHKLSTQNQKGSAASRSGVPAGSKKRAASPPPAVATRRSTRRARTLTGDGDSATEIVDKQADVSPQPQPLVPQPPAQPNAQLADAKPTLTTPCFVAKLLATAAKNIGVDQAEIKQVLAAVSNQGTPSVHSLVLLMHRWPYRLSLCIEIKRLLLSVLKISSVPSSDLSIGASTLERLFHEQNANCEWAVLADEPAAEDAGGVWIDDELEDDLDDDLKPAPVELAFSVDDFFA